MLVHQLVPQDGGGVMGSMQQIYGNHLHGFVVHVVIEPLLERPLCTLVVLDRTFTHPGQQGHVTTSAVIGARGRPHLARTYFLRELSWVRTDATKAEV